MIGLLPQPETKDQTIETMTYTQLKSIQAAQNTKQKQVMRAASLPPTGIWIRAKFKLKMDGSVKTPWQEYGVVARSK